MQLRLLTGCATWTAVALTAAACAGTLDDQQFEEVIGGQAELVQKKRAWLAGYERHCGVCFEAFKLCEKGSTDLADATNCEAALDACVHGGLINDDAGVNAADASSDVDAAPGEVVDAGLAASVDATTLFDAASIEDAGRVLAPRGDAGGRARPPFTGDKGQLAQSVGQCLSQIHDCLTTPAGAPTCVGTLRECVRSALTQNLADVCSTQLASCRAEGAPANAVRSVERLCRSDLGFATDAQ